MLKDEIEKKTLIKKGQKNSWPESWDINNFIEEKLKQIMKSNSQSIQCWRIKLRKKKKTWVN